MTFDPTHQTGRPVTRSVRHRPTPTWCLALCGLGLLALLNMQACDRTTSVGSVGDGGDRGHDAASDGGSASDAAPDRDAPAEDALPLPDANSFDGSLEDAAPPDGRSDATSDAMSDAMSDAASDGSDAAADGAADAETDGVAPSPAVLCTSTGGQVTTASCCTSVDDFPNTCAVGACSCSPAGSHTVSSCSCPTGTCFMPAQGCIAR